MNLPRFTIATFIAIVVTAFGASDSPAASQSQLDAARSFLDATEFERRVKTEIAGSKTGISILDMMMERMREDASFRAFQSRAIDGLPKIRGQLAEVYANRFSEAELLSLTRFFQSPVGKKYVTLLPDLRLTEGKLLFDQAFMSDPKVGEALETEKRRQAQVDADRIVLEQLANAGNPDAMYRLGTAYCNSPTPSDRKDSIAKCFAWKTRAAEGGHREAQFAVGFSYIDGRYGNQKSGSEMFKWLKRAADQGHSGAMFYVGSAYAGNIKVFGNQETGVEVNAKEAEAWLEKAAQEGGMGATMDLAAMYLEGRVVKRNVPQAIHWYTRAAEKKNTFAMRKLGEIYESGIDMEPNPREALDWYKRAAGVPR